MVVRNRYKGGLAVNVKAISQFREIFSTLEMLVLGSSPRVAFGRNYPIEYGHSFSIPFSILQYYSFVLFLGFL